MNIEESHKIERFEDGKVVWRRTWKETTDGHHYDEVEEFLDEEE